MMFSGAMSKFSAKRTLTCWKVEDGSTWRNTVWFRLLNLTYIDMFDDGELAAKAKQGKDNKSCPVRFLKQKEVPSGPSFLGSAKKARSWSNYWLVLLSDLSICIDTP